MKILYFAISIVLGTPIAAFAFETTRGCEREKNLDKRIAACTIYLEKNPTSGWAYYFRGAAYQLQAKKEWALLDYDAAIKAAPTDGVLGLHHALAIVELRKDYDRALLEVNDVFAAHGPLLNAKEKRIAYFARGKAYFGKKEYKKALKDFTQVVKLDPKFGDGYFARSEVYEKLGDENRAREDREASYRLSPSLTVGGRPVGG